MDKFMGVTMAMNRAMSRLERVAPEEMRELEKRLEERFMGLRL